MKPKVEKKSAPKIKAPKVTSSFTKRQLLESELEALFGLEEEDGKKTPIKPAVPVPSSSFQTRILAGKNREKFITQVLGYIDKSPSINKVELQKKIRKVASILNASTSNTTKAGNHLKVLREKVGLENQNLNQLKDEIRANLKSAIGASSILTRREATQKAHKAQEQAILAAKKLAYLKGKKEKVSTFVQNSSTKKDSKSKSPERPEVDLYRFGGTHKEQLKVLQFELENAPLDSIEKVIKKNCPKNVRIGLNF